MLESRSAYGFYGVAGGYTGEHIGKEEQTTRMPYWEYKKKWSDHKTVPGSYDSKEKTIEVIFTDDEMKKKTNLGNRYSMDLYYFRFSGVPRGFASILEFKAKNYENANRNAKKYAREWGYTLEGDATFNEYCGQFKYQ